MKRKTKVKAVTFNGNLWEINSEGSGCFVGIIKRSIEQLEIMESHHNKVFIMVFEIRHKANNRKQSSADNSHISACLKQLIRQIKKHYPVSRVGYLWSREREKAKHEHYHLAIMLDGNKISSSGKLFDLIRVTADTYNLSANIPKNPSYLLTRGAEDHHSTKQAVIWRLSYYAKVRGKGYKPSKTNDYSCSRLKAKQTEQAE
jgi:hypothetical protein